MRGSVHSLGIEKQVANVFCDSQGAIHQLTQNHMFYERTKHINVRYHFIHDYISSGKVLINKVIYHYKSYQKI